VALRELLGAGTLATYPFDEFSRRISIVLVLVGRGSLGMERSTIPIRPHNGAICPVVPLVATLWKEMPFSRKTAK
jgi:hypothetical protein